jgi:hypothetical protein
MVGESRVGPPLDLAMAAARRGIGVLARLAGLGRRRHAGLPEGAARREVGGRSPRSARWLREAPPRRTARGRSQAGGQRPEALGGGGGIAGSRRRGENREGRGAVAWSGDLAGERIGRDERAGGGVDLG